MCEHMYTLLFGVVYNHFSYSFITHYFWEAVCRLERFGLKVLAATADGASLNHQLAGFLLRWACLMGAHWDLSHPPNRRDPTRQLKPGTVAPKCSEDL